MVFIVSTKRDKPYNEEDLIKGCLANSRKHQEALYKTFYPDCYYMCHRYTSDPGTSRMIINDGFLLVFKNIQQFSGKGSLKAWIKRIVFNAMADYYRKESRYIKMIILDEKDDTDPNSPDENLYYDDILKMVEQLDHTTGQVFKLFAIDGYSHKEIGKLLHISEGNSKWHLHKARKILQKMITNKNKIRRHA